MPSELKSLERFQLLESEFYTLYNTATGTKDLDISNHAYQERISLAGLIFFSLKHILLFIIL